MQKPRNGPRSYGKKRSRGHPNYKPGHILAKNPTAHPGYIHTTVPGLEYRTAWQLLQRKKLNKK